MAGQEAAVEVGCEDAIKAPFVNVKNSCGGHAPMTQSTLHLYPSPKPSGRSLYSGTEHMCDGLGGEQTTGGRC